MEHRHRPVAEIRTTAEGRFTARVCVYNVVDDYGSVWRPGVFTDSLTRKLPKVVYHHQWHEPIGRVLSFTDDSHGLTVTAQLDDFEDVPRARQVWSQLRSGSLDSFSFGFVREEWKTAASDDDGWREQMIRARLDEVSPVLVGAVPGTALLSVRSAQRATPLRTAAEVRSYAGRCMRGEVPEHEWRATLRRLSDHPDLDIVTEACLALVDLTCGKPPEPERIVGLGPSVAFLDVNPNGRRW